jgi:hypothetical protein
MYADKPCTYWYKPLRNRSLGLTRDRLVTDWHTSRAAPCALALSDSESGLSQPGQAMAKPSLFTSTLASNCFS